MAKLIILGMIFFGENLPGEDGMATIPKSYEIMFPHNINEISNIIFSTKVDFNWGCK